MRWVIVLVVLATIGWCGYWFVGTRALDRAIAQGLERTPELSAETYHISGFPNRFDVTFDAPRVTLSDAEWTAPFVQFFALTYKPHHLLAVFPHDQVLRLGGTETLIHSEDLRASMVMEPGLDLPLDRMTLVGDTLDLQITEPARGTDTGATWQIGQLRLASRRTDDTTQQLVALAETVFPDPAQMDRVDPQRLWPRRFDTLRLDAEAETDRALDRHLVSDGAQVRLTDLTFTGLQITWPEVDFRLSGRLSPGADGRLSGDATANVTGWEEMLDILRASGLITDEAAAMANTTLAAMAQEDILEVPLSVVDGVVRLGPFALATLPPLSLAP
ncbi:DUF2125 domain-containing protein [Rhodobacter sp. NTK016B]|uniref:DUF2125 domain-containing protein n=1 Tax=Rhodobacter sp. NTK016B TaxID=2759676 RepID=UPI001A8EAAF9|nr:DUF2125 domain-containing protein [Rhodobacter sp. NTK016B]MBN8294470.1 DUF2125 domain-containing protein [Rhodobacter sp. NTK016B]